MRLKIEIKNQIIKYATQSFGMDIKLYLFGSRVHDDNKGGDIDLYLESSEEIDIKQQIKFLNNIYKHVTERKIDLIIRTPSKKDKPIFHTARQTEGNFIVLKESIETTRLHYDRAKDNEFRVLFIK